MSKGKGHDAELRRKLEHLDRDLAPVELGDIVNLHQAYKVRSNRYGQGVTCFSRGIVAEILTRLPDGRVRNVSLYLYDPESCQLYMGPNGIPEYVDEHCSQITLYKRATDEGYTPLV